MSFKPQDFSRFLIREFLKKSGFDSTYDTFMREDTRQKVTMTKNELTKLLGIDTLMKRNSKSKTYETMLDIICDFLMLCKTSNGGVTLPEGVGPTKTESNQAVVVNHKRQGSGIKKSSPTKTQNTWFSSNNNTQPENPIKQQDEDWDLEETKSKP